MEYGDKIFKLIQQCNKRCNTPDLHSFVADIKGGSVFVECRGYEVFIESTIYDDGGDEHVNKWVGGDMAAANRLEIMGIDLISVEI